MKACVPSQKLPGTNLIKAHTCQHLINPLAFLAPSCTHMVVWDLVLWVENQISCLQILN